MFRFVPKRLGINSETKKIMLLYYIINTDSVDAVREVFQKKMGREFHDLFYATIFFIFCTVPLLFEVSFITLRTD